MRRAIRNPLRDARALSARALREDPQCALARGHASAPIRKESAIRRPGDQRPPNPQQIRNPQSEIRNRTGFCYDRPSMRSDNRTPATLRPFTITPNINMHAEGSVLVEAGRTRVICTASVEDRVPQFLRGTGKGWVTAEYGMLPRATTTRTSREASTGKVGGRTQEIQRLIGRSLRSVVRLEELGERTIWLDCDVIQADGGTRTASITGAFVALVLALEKMRKAELIRDIPVNDYVAATSVGIVDGTPMLDLAYDEDSRAEVDMNVVQTGSGQFIEVQGTAETRPFDRAALDQLLQLAESGIRQLVARQRELVGAILGR